MTSNLEVQFLKKHYFTKQKILIFLGLFIFSGVLIDQTYFGKKPKAETQLPFADLSQVHYVGYLQTSLEFVALLEFENKKIIEVKQGMPLLDSTIEKISKRQIELSKANGKKLIIRLAGQR